MIKLGPNVWHYRLNNWLRKKAHIDPLRSRISLCAYFWLYVALLVGIIVAICISPIILLILGIVMLICHEQDRRDAKRPLTEREYDEMWMAKRAKKAARKKKVNLFVEFFKAKKNRVCPLLDFSDE